MRHRRWTPDDVRAALAAKAVMVGADADGNPVLASTIHGARVRVVVALDDPGFVITIIREGRG